MNFVTFAQLNADIIQNISKLPQNIDLVVGVPRSGMLVANMLALYLNKPFCDIDSFLKKRIYRAGITKNISGWKNSFEEIQTVLIVEDSVCSGNSINAVKEKIAASRICDKNILYLAAYAWKRNSSLVDFYFREINIPRAFEWNYLHIKLLESSCFDIDGILCEDPTKEQNDDGEKYRQFLLNAKPKFLPTQKIGCLVTSRLEKYRNETEKWLSMHNIKYGKLYMMNVATAEERQRLGNHAEFKAEIYKKEREKILFVESEPSQAETICKISKKAVFCPTNQKFYEESLLTTIKEKSKNGIRSFLYPFIPKFLLKLYRKIKYGRNIN